MAASQRGRARRRKPGRAVRAATEATSARSSAPKPAPPAAAGWEPIYAVVRRIPRGRVTSYGQVAALAGRPGHARQVGYALAALPADSRVPWQRVLNAQGRVSPRAEPGWDRLQRALLEREGVRFDARGRADLERCGWRPRPQPGAGAR